MDTSYYMDELSEEHLKAIEKNQNLIADLYDARKNFLNLGTNKVKRRLNKLAVSDPIAHAVRLALECEDKNIQAKEARGRFKSKIYDNKFGIIMKLVEVFQTNNWIYGIEKQEDYKTNSIIYFEIPGMEQISWHTNLFPNTIKTLPLYNKSWDGKINSTLQKIGDKIKNDYKDILK